MSKFKRAVIIIIVFLIPGCVVTAKNQSTNYPDHSSKSFPTFSYVTTIPDDLKKKVPEGKVKTKSSFNMTISMQQKGLTYSVDYEVDSNVTLNNDLIYYKATYKIFKKSGSQINQKTMNTIQVDAIYDNTGNLIKFDAIPENKYDMSDDELNDFIKSNIGDIFSNIGKPIRVGDVFRKVPNEYTKKLNELASQKLLPENFPEIVKGVGLYQNKKVIVTELFHELNVQESSGTYEARTKGYSLYDAETFVQLSRQEMAYIKIHTHSEDKVLILEGKGVTEAIDVQLKNTVGSTSMTILEAKKFAKPSENNGNVQGKITPGKSTIMEVPDNIKREIRKKCASDFPSDYANQADCLKKQEAGWLDLKR